MQENLQLKKNNKSHNNGDICEVFRGNARIFQKWCKYCLLLVLFFYS